jgi:hypothetical protein
LNQKGNWGLARGFDIAPRGLARNIQPLSWKGTGDQAQALARLL